MKRILLGATALALTIGPAGVWSMQNIAGAAAGDDFSCRASVVRVDPDGPLNPLPVIEPFIANSAGDPCTTDDTGLLNNQALGPLGTASVVFANTQNRATGSTANAGVVDLTLTVPGAPVIRAEVLTATANAGECQAGSTAPPTLSGASQVAALTIGGERFVVEDELGLPPSIPLGPAGTLYLNQQTNDGSTLTQRALFLDTPLADVVIAEAIADFDGNPCDPGGDPSPSASPSASPTGPPPTSPPPGDLPECSDGIDNDGDGRIDYPADPGCTNSEDDSEKDNGRPNDPGSDVPECSDEVDNDGDGKIDYPNDPGCDSPQDDNETDGSESPECSDGVDNDGDGETDWPYDPGCDSRDDDDEENRDNPECSDGVDNDRDGSIDHPADTGCTSPTDDDEAAGFITGGGGYDEIDKKTLPEDFVNPGDKLRFSASLSCDLGENKDHLNTTWFNDDDKNGQIAQYKQDAITRAFCRNDPFIDPRNPGTDFDTYVGAGTGTLRIAGVDVPANARYVLIDRGEPGSPPVIGVDYYEIHVYIGVAEVATGYGTLDHGNIQAHTPHGQFKPAPTTTTGGKGKPARV